MASFPKCRSCKESHASPRGLKCAFRLAKLGLIDNEHSKKKNSTETPEKSPSGEKLDKIIKLLEDTCGFIILIPSSKSIFEINAIR